MSSPFRLSLSTVTAIAVMLAAATEAGAAANRPAPVPIFARSIVVTPISGAVFVSKSGQPGVGSRLRRARAVASGSLIDVSGGDAMLVTATPHGTTTHTADLRGGIVRVVQQRADGGATNVILAGTIPACGSGHAAGYTVLTRLRIAHHGRRRYARDARAAGVGLFRLVGKNEFAVNDGPATYEGSEDCHGTTIGDKAGKVTASLKGKAKSTQLDPGETWLSRCSSPAQAAAVGPFCVAVLGDHDSTGDVTYTPGLFTATGASTYELCQATPSSPRNCQTWTFTTPDLNGYREGLNTCWASEAGSYSLSWAIDGTPLGISLPYTATAASKDPGPCGGDAGTRFYPPGRNSLPLASGIKIANSYALPSGWLEFISIYITPIGAGQESLHGVVYQDAGGRPGKLVATTDAFDRANKLFAGPAVVTGPDEPYYQGLYFKPNVEVPAGTYWFGVLTGGNSNVAAVRVESTAPVVFNANPSAAASDPFGPFLSATGQMSLQVGYSIDPPLGSSAREVPHDG